MTPLRAPIASRWPARRAHNRPIAAPEHRAHRRWPCAAMSTTAAIAHRVMVAHTTPRAALTDEPPPRAIPWDPESPREGHAGTRESDGGLLVRRRLDSAMAVLLDLVLGAQLIIHQESGHRIALVTLKLENVAHLLIFDDRAIAAVCLLTQSGRTY